MQTTAPPFHSRADAESGGPSVIALPDLRQYVEGWLLDCEIRQHSRRTLDARRDVTDKLLWFLERRERTSCGRNEIRLFLAYLDKGHEEPGGRWGNPKCTAPVRAATIQTYHRILRALFNWIALEAGLLVSPMKNVGVTVDRADQIQPFTLEQMEKMIAATAKLSHPRRDLALLLLLFDTGMRASEACQLVVSDIDTKARSVTIRNGKGGKKRVLAFGVRTGKALWNYLREDAREEHEPIFMCDSGKNTGEALTRSGLAQLFRRIGQQAGVSGVRCSPHTCRHTFAIQFLRNGGNEFTLMTMMGHTSLAQTKRYAAIADSDVAAQHRQFSPVDRLGKKER